MHQTTINNLLIGHNNHLKVESFRFKSKISGKELENFTISTMAS